MTQPTEFKQQDVPTFIKLRDGNWGIRHPGVIENMEVPYNVQVTRKNGKTQTLLVKFFWTNRSDVTLGEILNPDGSKKAPKNPPAAPAGGQQAQQPTPSPAGSGLSTAPAPAPAPQPVAASVPAPAPAPAVIPGMAAAAAPQAHGVTAAYAAAAQVAEVGSAEPPAI